MLRCVGALLREMGSDFVSARGSPAVRGRKYGEPRRSGDELEAAAFARRPLRTQCAEGEVTLVYQDGGPEHCGLGYIDGEREWHFKAEPTACSLIS